MLNITLRQFEAFLAVASLHSFTAAGKSLHITQSAVSGLIKELERQIDAPLFDRTSRTVFLSPDGEKFLPVARKAFHEFEVAERYAREMKDRRSSLIRITGDPLIACTILPVYVAEFLRLAQNISIELVDEPMSRVQSCIRNGDVSLGFGPERALELDIMARPLFQTPLSIICRPDHPLARKQVTWNMVKKEPLIVVGRESITKLSSDIGGRDGFRIAHVVEHMPTACALAATGQGIVVAGLFSLLLATGYGLTVIPVSEPVFNRNMLVYMHCNRPLSVADSLFLSFLEDYVRRHDPNKVEGLTVAGIVGALPYAH